MIKSLDRALEILALVAQNSGQTLSEIARSSGQATPTVYRILSTLQRHDFVTCEDRNQTWHIGAGAFRTGMAFLHRTQLLEQSRPVMERLMLATGETANLAIIDKSSVMFVNQVETHEPIRAFFRPGSRGPVHASGIGKAILAHFSPEQRHDIIQDTELVRFTEKTICHSTDLYQDLDKYKAQGWSVDDEEHTLGMRCIAAPVFNHDGLPVAGISISGPSVRMPQTRDHALGKLVRKAADEVTRAIGGVAGP